MNRTQALDLVHQYTTKPALITHMLAVETVMRHLADHYQQDADKWGLAGLLHDFDYEHFVTIPDHPLKGSDILAQQGVEEDIRQAIIGHANLPEHPRTSLMAKALFAVDELTGLVMAVTYVRPSKSVMDVEVSSVTKKMKDKTFAAGVNRQDIEQGAQELDLPIDQLIELVIQALRSNAQQLGLQGSAT